MATDRLREKFRQEIRSRQISTLMKISRERVLNESKLAHLFTNLDYKIKQSHSQLRMDIVQELLNVLEEYPCEENTYILIGNYLLLHPLAHTYFEVRVLSKSQVASKLDSYGWAFMVMFTRKEQFTSECLKDYDQTLCHILEKGSQTNLANNLNLLHIFLSMEAESRSRQGIRFYPENCIKYFLDLTSAVDIKKQPSDTQYLMVAITHCLCQHHLQMEDMRLSVPVLTRLLVLGISDYCKFRTQFLTFLSKMGVLWLDEFEEVFDTELGNSTASELFYMYENLSHERGILLQIFETMIQQFSFPILFHLLSMGLHITIANTVRTEPKDPDHLHKSLQLIHMLLSRLRDKEQTNTVEILLNSLEEHQFQEHLLMLMQQRQDPVVEERLAILVDDFYSTEEMS